MDIDREPIRQSIDYALQERERLIEKLLELKDVQDRIARLDVFINLGKRLLGE